MNKLFLSMCTLDFHCKIKFTKSYYYKKTTWEIPFLLMLVFLYHMNSFSACMKWKAIKKIPFISCIWKKKKFRCKNESSLLNLLFEYSLVRSHTLCYTSALSATIIVFEMSFQFLLFFLFQFETNCWLWIGSWILWYSRSKTSHGIGSSQFRWWSWT